MRKLLLFELICAYFGGSQLINFFHFPSCLRRESAAGEEALEENGEKEKGTTNNKAIVGFKF